MISQSKKIVKSLSSAKNGWTNLIAIILLLVMVTMAVLSMKDDSAIMDEVAHIPAGYSYLTQKDMRINPEHPPLLKDLAAIPLLFQKINFPADYKAWKEDVNGQWDFGFHFLYKAGNNADKIIFWSRIPMILILILLGYYIFRWTKELFGPKAGLLALALFSFSPTFIAHGRFVTTDVGATAAFFIATYYFVKFLQNSSKKNLIIAGIVFGIAQLVKFSLFLLVPYLALINLIWLFTKYSKYRKGKKKSLSIARKIIKRYIISFILILVIGYLVIYPLYQYHVWNYPPERQIRDTDFILTSFGIKPIATLGVWMASKPILKVWGQYLLGLLMVFQRAGGGNTAFFLGEISAAGWRNYFPIVYAIKPPLALHLLTIIVLLYVAWQIKEPLWKRPMKRAWSWIKNHFPEFSMLVFLGIYWATSISSTLNIGVRHVLPTLPFLYILISGQIMNWLKIKKHYPLPQSQPKFKKIFIKNYFTIIGKVMILVILLAWYVISSLAIFPYYLAHFNELVGGAKNGYQYVADSNLDWGQDLKRLTKWVDEMGIKKIKVDYFGGAVAEYYLKDKFEPWQGNRNPEEARGSWLAVSATFLQAGRGLPAEGFREPTGYYRWLYQYEPVTVIGHSIFVYYID